MNININLGLNNMQIVILKIKKILFIYHSQFTSSKEMCLLYFFLLFGIFKYKKVEVNPLPQSIKIY